MHQWSGLGFICTDLIQFLDTFVWIFFKPGFLSGFQMVPENWTIREPDLIQLFENWICSLIRLCLYTVTIWLPGTPRILILNHFIQKNCSHLYHNIYITQWPITMLFVHIFYIFMFKCLHVLGFFLMQKKLDAFLWV